MFFLIIITKISTNLSFAEQGKLDVFSSQTFKVNNSDNRTKVQRMRGNEILVYRVQNLTWGQIM